MFSQKNRLSREDFLTVLRKGRRSTSKNYTLITLSSKKGYAVVVPKKVVKKSVERHKIKRQITASLQALTLPNSLIVFLKSPVSGVHYENIREELQILLSKP